MKTLRKAFFCLLIVFCPLFATVCSSGEDEETWDEAGPGETANFIIDLAGTSRLANYPGYSPAAGDFTYLESVLTFSSGGTAVKSFTARGTSVIKGSITPDTYEVTLESFLISDSSLFLEGEGNPNPVTVNPGKNTINIDAYKSVTVSPDTASVSTTQTFNASVHGGGSVTWSVERGDGTAPSATINSSGNLDVSGEADGTVLIITASSGTNPERRGIAEVEVDSSALTISITPPTKVLTPMFIVSVYDERSLNFTVEVEGFTSASDATGVGLSISAPTGFSYSDNEATAFVSGGPVYKKTYSVTITYNGTTAFPDPAQTVSITGLTSVPGGYSAFPPGYSADTTVTVYDGQSDFTGTYDRRIPVNNANKAYFNSFAADTVLAIGLGKHYRQTESFTPPNPWTPIGTSSIGSGFSGSFDGGTYEIDALAITTISSNDQGMFGYISGMGVVRNVHLINVNITGNYSNVGAIAGSNYGAIRGCSVSNAAGSNGIITSLTSSQRIGGIVGENGGLVENCYTTCDVTGHWYIGGIAGRNIGIIRNCYSTSYVSGEDLTLPPWSWVGGITGINDGSGMVQNCYVTGIINGGLGPGSIGVNGVGGIVGNSISSSSVRNCVALNPYLVALSTFSRIDAGAPGILDHNYGRYGMKKTSNVGGGSYYIPGWGDNLNVRDGKDITTAQYNTLAWWTTTANWSTASGASVWDFTTSGPWIWNTTNSLPILKNMPGTQNHTVLPIPP